jgi:predicted secreted hydrolase
MRLLLVRYPLGVVLALVVTLLAGVVAVASFVDGTFLRRVVGVDFQRFASPSPLPDPDPSDSAPGLRSLLGMDDTAANGPFVRVRTPIEWQFPRDHGAHPDQRVEWWYLTGHLSSPARAGSSERPHRYGFQVTFFRFGLASDRFPQDVRISDPSKWRSKQIFMAHMAITDFGNAVHRSAERTSRGALGLASAATDDADVDVLGWRLRREARTAGGGERWLVDVASEVGSLSLTLDPAKPLVFPGVNGYSVKGDAPGQASAYYSITRLRARGQLSLSGGQELVEGSAWLDREWSSGTMGPRQSGWDWLAIQFDNATELMLYRIRQDDGGTDPASAGLFVDARGRTITLGVDDISWRPERWWTEPSSGARYPIAWQIAVAKTGHQLQVEAALDDQLMRHSVRYWEGAVRVTGRREQRNLTGSGYLELVGYER